MTETTWRAAVSIVIPGWSVRSKYPPAEPGALGIGPLEAATLNPKLCLLGRRTKYTLPTLPPPFIQFFATPENRCLLRIASLPDGVKVSRLSIVKLHFVCVVAHDLMFRRWATAVNVKLILPPRQSLGVSGYARYNAAHRHYDLVPVD